VEVDRSAKATGGTRPPLATALFARPSFVRPSFVRPSFRRPSAATAGSASEKAAGLIQADPHPTVRSFGVALRSEPVDAAGALQPFIDLVFARKPFDVANFGPRIVGLNLPVALSDSL